MWLGGCTLMAPGFPMRQQAKAAGEFILMSLSTSVPSAQMALAALIKYLPESNEEENKKCCKAFNIPGYSHCPETLFDVAKLENYYKQLSLERLFGLGVDCRTGG